MLKPALDSDRARTIFGYVFDGYPIYGPYAYANTDGTGGIQWTRSSAYSATIDALGASEYPYAIGPQYHGVVEMGNTGPIGGHVPIGETVTEYAPPAANRLHAIT